MMETLIITVRDEEKRERIEQLLSEMEGVEAVRRLPVLDEVTELAQGTLSEEWDSPEDQRWDSLL